MSDPQSRSNSNPKRGSEGEEVPKLRKRGEKYGHAADGEGESGNAAAELNLVHGYSAMWIGFIHTILSRCAVSILLVPPKSRRDLAFVPIGSLLTLGCGLAHRDRVRGSGIGVGVSGYGWLFGRAGIGMVGLILGGVVGEFADHFVVKNIEADAMRVLGGDVERFEDQFGATILDGAAKQGLDEIHERGLDGLLVLDERDGRNIGVNGAGNAVNQTLMEVTKMFAFEGGRATALSANLDMTATRMSLNWHRYTLKNGVLKLNLLFAPNRGKGIS